MMGTKSGDQDRLFYSFNLDEHVPADHLLRRIDQYLVSALYAPTWRLITVTQDAHRWIRSS